MHSVVRAAQRQPRAAPRALVSSLCRPRANLIRACAPVSHVLLHAGRVLARLPLMDLIERLTATEASLVSVLDLASDASRRLAGDVAEADAPPASAAAASAAAPAAAPAAAFASASAAGAGASTSASAGAGAGAGAGPSYSSAAACEDVNARLVRTLESAHDDIAAAIIAVAAAKKAARSAAGAASAAVR